MGGWGQREKLVTVKPLNKGLAINLRFFCNVYMLLCLKGGLVFFSVKTFLKAYLRQQEYRRQGSRTVLSLKPTPEP
jgi:hypothetical protein